VGYAFAVVCRRHGMHVALLDKNSETLHQASNELKAMGSTSTHPGVQTLTYNVDVSDPSAWATVHDSLSPKFDTVDFLMLNAGASFTPSTSQPWEDVSYFQNTMSTNLFGVVNGLATFLPMVQKSSGPSSIILTGSKQGITNPPGNPAYNASKAAIKSLAEQLAHFLRTPGTPSHAPHVSAHLLIPGWAFTGLSGNKGPIPDSEASKVKPKGAWLPSQVADYGYKKMQEGKFYIVCPDEDVDEALDQARMMWAADDAVAGRSPLSRWDANYKEKAAQWIGKEAERRRGGGK